MDKQKEFNSKAQKIRRLRSNIAASGNAGNLISPEQSVRRGRQAIKNEVPGLNIHRTINDPNTPIEVRRKIVVMGKLDRNMNKKIGYSKKPIPRKPMKVIRLKMG